MLDDFGTELEEIKREIVESRSLSIKTNNLVNALSADMNSIAKRQQAYERKLRWDSAVAYVVTSLLLLIAAKIVVDARVEAVRADSKDGRERLGQLEKELDRLRATEEERSKSERAAGEFYALIKSDKHRDVLTQFEALKNLQLTRTERQVFAAARDRAASVLSLDLYHEGLDHIRTRRWHEAEQALRQSLQYKPNAAHASQAQYQLARALRTLGKQREAIPLLMKLSEASSDPDVMDDATFLLAETQLDIEAYNDAKATLRAFMRRFPSSPLLNDARSKLSTVRLHH